jgi:hypothetical protein
VPSYWQKLEEIKKENQVIKGPVMHQQLFGEIQTPSRQVTIQYTGIFHAAPERQHPINGQPW